MFQSIYPKLQSTGLISPSPTRFRVAAFDYKPGLETLKLGDVVIVVNGPDNRSNYLFREIDCTLHSLKDDSENYILVEPI